MLRERVPNGRCSKGKRSAAQNRITIILYSIHSKKSINVCVDHTLDKVLPVIIICNGYYSIAGMANLPVSRANIWTFRVPNIWRAGKTKNKKY